MFNRYYELEFEIKGTVKVKAENYKDAVSKINRNLGLIDINPDEAFVSSEIGACGVDEECQMYIENDDEVVNIVDLIDLTEEEKEKL